MPNINDISPSLESLEPAQLHARYRDLANRGAVSTLSDEELHEACAILKALRRKSIGPPKVAKKAPKGSKTVIASEELL